MRKVKSTKSQLERITARSPSLRFRFRFDGYGGDAEVGRDFQHLPHVTCERGLERDCGDLHGGRAGERFERDAIAVVGHGHHFERFRRAQDDLLRLHFTDFAFESNLIRRDRHGGLNDGRDVDLQQRRGRIVGFERQRLGDRTRHGIGVHRHRHFELRADGIAELRRKWPR